MKFAVCEHFWRSFHFIPFFNLLLIRFELISKPLYVDWIVAFHFNGRWFQFQRFIIVAIAVAVTTIVTTTTQSPSFLLLSLLLLSSSTSLWEEEAKYEGIQLVRDTKWSVCECTHIVKLEWIHFHFIHF